MNKQIYVLAILAGLFLYNGSYAQTPSSAQPDNSVVNKRDHSADAKTADHQANHTKSDTDVTRMIRRELTKDSALSTDAQNIKIITTADTVTLRGPVHTGSEKEKIAAVAKTIATGRTIQNELEIKQ